MPAEGLEPPNSEEGGFTVPSNCRYAIQAFNVILQGFEPRTTEPKSVVLPLHHRILFNMNFKEHYKDTKKISQFQK